MPGIPRPRLARILRRRNDSDSRRAADLIVVGGVSALAFLILCAPALALVAAIASALGALWLARRIVRRNGVLTALAKDGGVVVVGRESGGHQDKVTKSDADRESAR